jgi:hypothetical protein
MAARGVTCPTDEVLAAWSAGALRGRERDAVEGHAAACSACRGLAVALAGVAARDPANTFGAEGAMIGRYRVVGSIGQGAMGVVLRGHDPVLDREVAIKMLASTAASPRDQRERMLREAQVLARLDHPNIVDVFDAGVVGDEVFVAMELVTGATLSRWLARTPRTTAERIAVLAGVGSGIAAVHAAGLVHRDIKPDNVIVRDSGAAVLIDFGLARASAVAGAVGSGIAGTPRFLAPELASGAVATAASDQYAWWTVVEDLLRDAKLSTIERRRIDRAVARGRAADPAARFASMPAAIAALAPRRRRWPVVAGAVVVAGAALGVGVALHAPGDACASDAERVWRAHRPAIAARLAGAGANTPAVLAALDARAERTAALHVEACRATDDRSQAMRRQLCVDESWSATEPLFAGLGDADPHLVRAAVDDLVDVLPVERCAHGSLPAIPAPPPPDKRADAEVLAAELRAIQLGADRNPAHRLDRLRVLEPRVRALDVPETSLRWHSAFASALKASGDLAGSERELELAIQLAETAGDDDARVRGLINRLRIAMALGQTDTTAIEREAEAAASRLGNPAITAQLHTSEGLVRYARGDLPGALVAMRAGQRELDAVAIDAHAQQVLIAQNLGSLEQTTGDFKAAQATLDRGYEVARRRFGDLAPDTLEIRGARATNVMYAGDIARARPELAAVADALARALGPRSEQVVQARSYICEADLHLDAVAAAASCDAALASAQLVYGDAHPQIIWQLMLVGQQRLATGHATDALAPLERALALTEHAAIGPSDRPLAEGYVALALHDLHRDPQRAGVLARDALATLRAMPDKRELVGQLDTAFAH